MDRTLGIVRWSPNQSRDEFLGINLNNRVVHLYKATGHARPDRFDYEKISRHSEFPGINTYDWSPVFRGLVAVGTPQGEVHLLRIDDNSNAKLTLPLKLQRACQAVSFNTTGLLAVGLDRVRNDSCLQIWDVNERLASWDSSKPGWTEPSTNIGPNKKLEGSISITSIRFFEDNPQTLICGVKNQAVKIYDLRDPHSPAITFQTRCNNNLALNYVDTNYFASSTLDQPGLVVFDKRAAGGRTIASQMYCQALEEDNLPWGAVLKLDQVIEDDKNAFVKQLRFSREHNGALAVLSTSGQLQILQTKKEYVDPNSPDDVSSSPQLLEVKKSYELERSYSNPESEKKFEQRLVSFDWVYAGTSELDGRMIGLQANGDFSIFHMPATHAGHLQCLLPLTTPHKPNEPYLALPKFKDAKEREVVLGPLYKTAAQADVPVFGQHRYSSLETRTKFFGEIKRSLECGEDILVDLITSKESPTNKLDQIGLSMAGYLFDCQKNKSLVEKDSRLKDVWEWVAGAEEAAKDDGMVASPLDLSYLGVYYIWMNQLGEKSQSRLIDSSTVPDSTQWEYLISVINRRNRRPEFVDIDTKRPNHRQLCLAISGSLRTEEELMTELDVLMDAGDHAAAACLALFEGIPQYAIEILKNGGSDYLFMAMALDIKIKTNASLQVPESEWKKVLDSNPTLSNNAHIRAIYQYITMRSWETIVDERLLPLRQRASIALRNFNDEQLTEWLEKEMEEAINTGDIEGIILSGITDPTVSILAKYVEKFGDYQTPILIMSFCYPRYINDIRCDAWREAYRDFLHRHKRFIDRVRFERESTKKSRDRNGFPVIKPSLRAVTIRCLNCDKNPANDLAYSVPGSASIPTPSSNPQAIAGINAGLKCPRCSAGLPRCAVCMHSVLGIPRSDRPELSTDNQGGKSANFPTFCLKCKHVMHMDHAKLWFARHDECPVSECHCRCDDVANREMV